MALFPLPRPEDGQGGRPLGVKGGGRGKLQTARRNNTGTAKFLPPRKTDRGSVNEKIGVRHSRYRRDVGTNGDVRCGRRRLHSGMLRAQLGGGGHDLATAGCYQQRAAGYARAAPLARHGW